MNVSATFSVFKLFRDPALCLPHSTISTFNHLPIPLSKAFVKAHGEKDIDIRAVVLDKDNCFARPKENVIYKPYNVSNSFLYCCLLVSSLLGRIYTKPYLKEPQISMSNFSSWEVSTAFSKFVPISIDT